MFIPVAYAQNYTPLAPIPGTVDSQGQVDISNYIPRVFTTLIGIAGVLAVVMIVIGGIQYMSTDAILGKSEGKEKIKNALWGLLLALGAWAILYTINPNLLNLNIGNLQSVQQYSVGTTTGGVVTQCYQGVNYSNFVANCPWPSDQFIRDQFLANGITINNNNCTTVGQTGCTSVWRLDNAAFTGLVALKNGCEAGSLICNVTITAGTEYWLHGNTNPSRAANSTGHGPGRGVVDIRNTDSNINTYITTNGQSLGVQNICSSLGPAWNLSGAIYVDETTHWHICF